MQGLPFRSFWLVVSNVTVSYHRQSLLSTLSQKSYSQTNHFDFIVRWFCPFGVGCAIMLYISFFRAKELFSWQSTRFTLHHPLSGAASGQRRCAGGAGTGRPLRQRQDHDGRRIGRAVSGQHRPAHRRFLPAARRPCARLGTDALCQLWTLPACGTKPCAQPTRASRCSTVPIPAAGCVPARAGAGRAAAGDFGGSYSHHPLLTGYETLRVFLTYAKEEQTRRLQAREGERYANFAARWVPLEEGYFASTTLRRRRILW